MRLLLLGGVSLVVAVAWVLVPRADADVIAPYVVVFEDGVDAKAKVAELEEAHAFRADHTYVSSITGFAAKLARRQRDAIARDPAVCRCTRTRHFDSRHPRAARAARRWRPACVASAAVRKERRAWR